MRRNNPFKKSEGQRIKITKAQEKQIKKLYQDVADEIEERAKYYAGRTNAGSMLRLVQLNDLKSSIKDSMDNVNSSSQSIIKSNMMKMSQVVFKDNVQLLKAMGFIEVDTRYAYVPRDIVNQLVSGKLYKGKWSLSKSIWNNSAVVNHDLDYIIAKGIAENKSTYEIAKDLEKYVNPSRAKPWDWGKVYPGTKKVIDYNAQRLARTMVSHAYEESFVRSTKNNPFIEAYQWLSSGGDRMCEVCAERDGKIFAKDELPFDHPNGMCTFMIVMEKSYEQIGQDLANWVNGEGDPKLNEQIDGFAEDLYLRGRVNTNINDLNRAQFVNDSIKYKAKK